MMRNHQTGWAYPSRYTDARYGGYEYSMALVGADGAHFHFWVPRGTTYDQLRRAASHCRNQRDLVRWTWDYIPGLPPLTQAKQRAYIRNYGLKCPYCESTSLDSDRVDVDHNVGHANVTCLDCKAEWVDVWRLVGVEAADEKVS